MIEFRDVTKKYGSNDPVLDKINFLIEKGSFVYLIGPTGSGKTTIFRMIIRDVFPTDGAVMLGEWNLSSLPKSKVPLLRRTVGVVFQDLKLLVDRTVLENVMLPLQFSGVSDPEAKRKSIEAIIEVGLAGKEDKFPMQLSGGERQRVAIARALVFSPELILADEPTGNLDATTSQQILDLLKNINKKGTTVFMATHNEKFIETTDSRVIALEKGKIVEDRKAKGNGKAHDEKKASEEDHDEHKKADEKKHESESEKKEEHEKSDKVKLEELADKEKK